ncbi:flagellar export protein FliJ [Salinimonas sp. HHU 13199]|uniref:Flagellar FliJ protein n=1 Tax=Salinimonas profundi TaxID=2729140 RepID=A0ABR8LGE6_9ALTE|nr:flagellar export protein FliJ [Salinimonas profundi]MBD3585329.1 flagellar export protein FliJ [Salinimonas profundi]
MGQLDTVIRVERDREEKAAQAYQMAQHSLNEQRQKLSSLQQYRLDYLRNLQQNGQHGGLDARDYHQHLQFVAKLDKACEQQNQIISRASLVVDQRRQHYLQQQKRRKAVDFLIDKKQHEAAVAAGRREQDQLDEFAAQRFLRAKTRY